MPRHCTICCDRHKLRRAAELIAEGVSDVAGAAELKVGRMSVQRHRMNHVQGPAQALAATSRAVIEQRAFTTPSVVSPDRLAPSADCHKSKTNTNAG